MAEGRPNECQGAAMNTAGGDDAGLLPDPQGRGRCPDVREWLREAADVDAAQAVEVLQRDQLERWRHGQRVPAEAYLQLLGQARLPGAAAGAGGDEALDLVY